MPFKEFEARLKIKYETRFKHGLFHLKLHSVFRDLSRRSIGTGFWRISDAVEILYIRFLEKLNLNMFRLSPIIVSLKYVY